MAYTRCGFVCKICDLTDRLLEESLESGYPAGRYEHLAWSSIITSTGMTFHYMRIKYVDKKHRQEVVEFSNYSGVNWCMGPSSPAQHAFFDLLNAALGTDNIKDFLDGRIEDVETVDDYVCWCKNPPAIKSATKLT